MSTPRTPQVAGQANSADGCLLETPNDCILFQSEPIDRQKYRFFRYPGTWTPLQIQLLLMTLGAV